MFGTIKNVDDYMDIVARSVNDIIQLSTHKHWTNSVVFKDGELKLSHSGIKQDVYAILKTAMEDKSASVVIRHITSELLMLIKDITKGMIKIELNEILELISRSAADIASDTALLNLKHDVFISELPSAEAANFVSKNGMITKLKLIVDEMVAGTSKNKEFAERVKISVIAKVIEADMHSLPRHEEPDYDYAKEAWLFSKTLNARTRLRRFLELAENCMLIQLEKGSIIQYSSNNSLQSLAV